jgi:hypothetical protein
MDFYAKIPSKNFIIVPKYHLLKVFGIKIIIKKIYI